MPLNTRSDSVPTRHDNPRHSHSTAAIWVSAFNAIKDSSPDLPLHLYAIVDGALDPYLWRKLSQYGHSSRPLLTVAADAKSSSVIPYLVALANPSQDAQDGIASLPPSAALTLLSSPLTLDQLHMHFQAFLDIRLSGGLSIILAFWDPAILGPLVGQADDHTLHVPGPILTEAQRQAFLQPVAGWWYTDRESHWHSIRTGFADSADRGEPVFPQRLELTQEQEDLLVEASLPDQVLYQLEENQPGLFPVGLAQHRKYRFVRATLGSARQLGLSGMRDLVSFVALCLIYRQRMQTDERIVRLLDQVYKKEMTLEQAMALMPE